MNQLNIVFIFLLLLSIVGCDENLLNESNKEVVKGDVVQKNTTKEEENDLLKQLGFDMSDDKIVIDTNKTSTFFENIEQQMEKKAKVIEQKIDNADINMTQGMGIDVKDEKIGIDLNKTRNMVEQIKSLVKDILLDINSSTH